MKDVSRVSTITQVEETGMDVKVQKPGSLFIQRKATSVKVSVNCLRLVVVLHPLQKVSIRTITS